MEDSVVVDSSQTELCEPNEIIKSEQVTDPAVQVTDSQKEATTMPPIEPTVVNETKNDSQTEQSTENTTIENTEIKKSEDDEVAADGLLCGQGATDSTTSLNTYTTTKTSAENGTEEADSDGGNSSGAVDKSQTSLSGGDEPSPPSSTSETTNNNTSVNVASGDAHSTLNDSNEEYKSINESLNQNTSSSLSSTGAAGGNTSGNSGNKKLPNDSSLDDDDDAYEDLDEYDDDVENFVDVQDGAGLAAVVRKPLSAFNVDDYEDDDEAINGDEYKLDAEFEKLSLIPPQQPLLTNLDEATASDSTNPAATSSTTRLSEKLGIDLATLISATTVNKKAQFYGHDDSRDQSKESSPAYVLAQEVAVDVNDVAKLVAGDAATTTVDAQPQEDSQSTERWSHDKYNPALVNTSKPAARNRKSNRNSGRNQPSRQPQQHQQQPGVRIPNSPLKSRNGGGKSKGISLSEYLEPTGEQQQQILQATLDLTNGTVASTAGNTDQILNSTAISVSNTANGQHFKQKNHVRNALAKSERRYSTNNENSSSSSSTVTGPDRQRHNGMNGGGGGGQRRNNQRNGNYADNGVAGGVLTGLPVDLKKRLDFSTKKQHGEYIDVTEYEIRNIDRSSSFSVNRPLPSQNHNHHHNGRQYTHANGQSASAAATAYDDPPIDLGKKLDLTITTSVVGSHSRRVVVDQHLIGQHPPSVVVPLTAVVSPAQQQPTTDLRNVEFKQPAGRTGGYPNGGRVGQIAHSKSFSHRNTRHNANLSDYVNVFAEAAQQSDNAAASSNSNYNNNNTQQQQRFNPVRSQTYSNRNFYAYRNQQFANYSANGANGTNGRSYNGQYQSNAAAVPNGQHQQPSSIYLSNNTNGGGYKSKAHMQHQQQQQHQHQQSSQPHTYQQHDYNDTQGGEYYGDYSQPQQQPQSAYYQQGYNSYT